MLKKTAVIYQTSYGSTERYARWIAKALNADLYESKKAKPDKLDGYDRLIFGGGLYAVSIGGIQKFTKNADKLANKEVIYFSVGLSTVTDEVVQSILDRNFSKELQQKVKFFALRGAFNYRKLSWIHKMMMNMLKKMILKKGENLSDDERQMLLCYDMPVDFVKEENIKPILEYCGGE